MNKIIEENPVCLQRQTTTINGEKTDKHKLGLVGARVVKAILTAGETQELAMPDGLEVVCRGLYSVWQWPEDAKPMFWKIFIYLLTKLLHMWSASQFPGAVVMNKDCRTWNIITWVNTFVNFMANLRPVFGIDHCWRLIGNYRQLPVLKVTIGECHTSPGQGTRFQDTVGKCEVKYYRLLGLLEQPELPSSLLEDDRLLQWCHRCYNNPQLCCNPKHGLFGPDQLNKGMHKCVNGAAFYCTHDPKCIYVTSDGIPIPCRNLTSFPSFPCTCSVNCHLVRPGGDGNQPIEQ